MIKQRFNYIIGIDVGVHTGFAVWDVGTRRLIEVSTMKIHEAMDRVMAYSGSNTFVRVEDARQRKWFGKSGCEKLQGAGSIKRDSQIWDDFLTSKCIQHEMVAPCNNTTKLDGDVFARLTKWDKRTSEHSRDAAMLVYGY